MRAVSVRPASAILSSNDENRYSFQSSIDDQWSSIEREVDQDLINLDPDNLIPSPRPSRDVDVEMEGFLSQQPQYHESMIVKKFQLYEKKLAIREQQIAKLQALYTIAKQSISKLQMDLETQQKEIETAQDEWEEEKNQLLRANAGTNGGNTSSTMMFQLKMGASAAAMAARSRNHEVETQKQREQRLQMLNGAAEAQDLMDDTMSTAFTTTSLSATSLIKKLERIVLQHFIFFVTDIRQIEARFGYAVASYFRFFRWIIMSFLAISIPGWIFLFLHFLFIRQQHLDWSIFAGIAPRILLLSGYDASEAMTYTSVLLSMELLMLFITIRKWIAEDHLAKTMEAMNEGIQPPKYSKVLLNAWDFSLTSQEQVHDCLRGIAEQLQVTMEEDQVAERIRQRTRAQWYILYTRRFLSILFYGMIQAASWYVIILLTTQSSEIQQVVVTKAAILAPYVSTLVPAVVTMINSILPTLISILTKFEQWDDIGFAIKAMVTRLYLAKVLNVLIQLVSYALLLDPYLLTASPIILFDIIQLDGASIRRNVMLAFKSSVYLCRAEQVGSGLLMLVVTDFAVSKVAALAAPLIGWVLVHVQYRIAVFRSNRKHGNGKVVPEPIDPTRLETAGSRPSTSMERPPDSIKVEIPPVLTLPKPKKSEFQVPQKIVALLYSCTLTLVAIPLAPTTAILALFLHLFNFKFDKMILMNFQQKPVNPWSAKDAGSFFIKFYFCTIVIFLGFSHFFLGNVNLPKQCALQDTNKLLCQPNTYTTSTQVCDLDRINPSTAYFVDTINPKSECNNGLYPHCICGNSLACGPFTTLYNGYSPVTTYITTLPFIRTWYQLILSNTSIAWIGVGMTTLTCFFIRNSLRVHRMIALTREHEVSITFSSLRKKIKQLENRLRLQKMTTESTELKEE